ncbi:basic proline-rich protein-like [Eschrichtius robustus]|uniref:basic proline-rich protein-like n=1 Tax=Eschrichtius robustus TaxID=9764 RepID=UPI0035BFB7A7
MSETAQPRHLGDAATPPHSTEPGLPAYQKLTSGIQLRMPQRVRSQGRAVTVPPGWVCPWGRPRPNPRPSGRDGGGHLPGVAGVCPPSPPTPRCPPGPALGVGACLLRAGPGGGPRAAPSVGAAAEGQARAPLGPPQTQARPGPARPAARRCLPAASRAGVEGRRDPDPTPAPGPPAPAASARLPPASPPTRRAAHSPRAPAAEPPPDTGAEPGPARPALHKVTAPELRGGGAWAPEVPPPGSAPPVPTGGHFRSRGV